MPRPAPAVASNVPNSTRIYDCEVKPDAVEDIGNLGDIEALRPAMKEGHMCEANTLYWMTDRTPHEGVVVEGRTEPYQRSFFRVVGPGISLWYKDHSTANPKCAVPETVTIVEGSKFVKPNVKKAEQDRARARACTKPFHAPAPQEEKAEEEEGLDGDDVAMFGDDDGDY